MLARRRGPDYDPAAVTVTDTGLEAIPFATTTRVLAPSSIPAGSVKSADDFAPGATVIDVISEVRA
jgi:hypothetical protein